MVLLLSWTAVKALEWKFHASATIAQVIFSVFEVQCVHYWERFLT
jgi:hypothetical protein